MGGMNWDKVRREKPLIEHYDYSALMDAADRGVSLDGGDLSDRMAERRERLGLRRPAPARSTKPPKVASARVLTTAKRPGESKNARARRIAKQLGISEAELQRRRAKEQERERELKAEADRRGITVKKLRKLLDGKGTETAPGSPHRQPRKRPLPAQTKAKPASGDVIVSRGKRH